MWAGTPIWCRISVTGKLIGIQRDRLRAASTAGGTQYPADQHVFIERLHEKEREAVI